MKSIKDYLIILFNCIRCLPHIILYLSHNNRIVIDSDIKAGLKNMKLEYRSLFGLLYLLSFCKEYRNLFYYRTRPFSFLLNLICHQEQTLFIQTKKIGEGLTIVHGFATAIGAESIGKNCLIFQQVTIGGTDHGAPTIMDNVKIYAGAIIVGKITVGNNVVIGANATVYKDVPDNSMVFPGTSKVMRWNKK